MRVARVDQFQIARFHPARQRGLRVFQCDQMAIERGAREPAPGDRVVVKEFEAAIERVLLAGIDQRHAGQGGGQHRHRIGALAIQLAVGAVPRIFVVVAGKGHAVCAGRVTARRIGVECAQTAGIGLTPGDLDQQVIERPVISHVERVRLHFGRVGLGQHEHGFDLIELGARLIPEIDRQCPRHVAAKSVDIGIFQPVAHGVDHAGAHVRLAVIQPDHIGPDFLMVVGQVGVMVSFQFAGRIALVPVGVAGDPDIVPPGVIGHPVEDHFEALGVGGADEVAEIVQVAEFGVHRQIVADGIRAAERALAELLADRVDRHDPQHIDAHPAQARQMRFECAECALRRVLANVDFIDRGVRGPGGMPDLRDVFGQRQSGRGNRRCGHCQHGGQNHCLAKSHHRPAFRRRILTRFPLARTPIGIRIHGRA